KRYRFAGAERDDESGYYQMGSRYYAPWLGRFTSCDPKEGDTNQYRYVRGRPMVRVDPSGADDEQPSSLNLAANISSLLPGQDHSGSVAVRWPAAQGGAKYSTNLVGGPVPGASASARLGSASLTSNGFQLDLKTGLSVGLSVPVDYKPPTSPEHL